MFDWRKEKIALHAKLDTFIRNGCTYAETKHELDAQFIASCDYCVLTSPVDRYGKSCRCEKGQECFFKNAYERYLDVAKEKCGKENN